ncbi:MAG: hypothetical protein I4N50_23565, partial [Rhizobium sp.]|jgi:hypothetical protein|nr:hypothetical protein [Rhizobium sp.]
MRKRAANERDIAHAGQANIADILASPAEKAIVLLAGNRSSYALLRHSVHLFAVCELLFLLSEEAEFILLLI